MSLFNIFIIALVAFAISLVSGGGAGLLLIPVLGYILPATQVPAALTIGTSVSSVTKIYLFSKHINWHIVKLFLPAALPGVFLGAWLLSYLDPMYVEFCIAVYLLSNLPFVFKDETETSDNRCLPDHYIRWVGALAGFISGLTGAVGVMFNRVYMQCGLAKEDIVATRAANEIILHIVKLGLYFSLGLFTSTALQLGLLVALAAIISTFVMRYVLPRIPYRAFSKVGYGAMVVSGALLFNSAVIKLYEAHEQKFEFKRIARGYDATLHIEDVPFSVKFIYGTGFVYEKYIPVSELSTAHQKYVDELSMNVAKVVIRKRYALTKVTYRAYFYDEQDRIIRKVNLPESNKSESTEQI
jgi:uncharacterized protein